ncbi:Gfo/Idh/MocA family oxidoreductase [Pseudonocardia tropica]|uniref:Gfo/Idh/MocA family oxidoreductase n=1 Tax=Pseudonocardia tropica TaxID=681289 RepID=A0ABV1JRF1_9PSEU
MKVAVLGAGLAAGGHLRALHTLAGELDLDVVAVATRDETRAERVRSLFPGAQRRWPAEAALDGADLALVLTPPDTHLELVGAAAARGVHVLVEKPLDLTADRAGRLVAATEAAGTGLAVCFQHRAKEAGRGLKEAVASGALGPLVGGSLEVAWWRPQSYYDEPGRGSHARDGGGVLITQAIHTLDLLVWALGPPRRVVATATRSPVHDLEAEDTVTGLLDFGGGTAVSVFVTTAAFPGAAERLTLAGGRGTAVLDGPRLALHPNDGGPVRTLGTAGPAGIGPDTAEMPAEWHVEILRDAVTAFRAGGEPLASGRSALVTQTVVQALYVSARNGAWEPVPRPGAARVGALPDGGAG